MFLLTLLIDNLASTHLTLYFFRQCWWFSVSLSTTIWRTLPWPRGTTERSSPVATAIPSSRSVRSADRSVYPKATPWWRPLIKAVVRSASASPGPSLDAVGTGAGSKSINYLRSSTADRSMEQTFAPHVISVHSPTVHHDIWLKKHFRFSTLSKHYVLLNGMQFWSWKIISPWLFDNGKIISPWLFDHGKIISPWLVGCWFFSFLMGFRANEHD